MTFEEIIKSAPEVDPKNIYVYVGEVCVWDYKAGDNSILLISEPPCLENEKVTLCELINYANDLDLPIEVLTLQCEDKREKYNTAEWSNDSLILSF